MRALMKAELTIVRIGQQRAHPCQAAHMLLESPGAAQLGLLRANFGHIKFVVIYGALLQQDLCMNSRPTGLSLHC